MRPQALPSPSVITDRSSVDVAIIGGGPAGAAAACLLAKWGHSVTVLTRPGASSSALGESLPPSTRKLLGRIGVLAAVDAAGFVRSRGHTVWWGESHERVEEFPPDTTGYQVFRHKLDRVLLDGAIAAGARVRENTVVAHVEPGPTTHRISFTHDGSSRDVRARWVLDCSGRSGVVARRDFRRWEEGRNTVALVGLWRRTDGWNLPDATHTLVESFADGWAWSVPVDDERRYFTVMVDPRLTDMTRGKDLGSTYRSEMSKTRRLSALVDSQTMESDPWACSASMYSASRYGDERLLLVGDAASFLDPISSFGVKKALSSGWRAAVVTHTCLGSPEMEAASLDLHETRERRIYASYLAQSAEVFGEAGAIHRHPFWTARSVVGGDHDEVDEDGELDIGILRTDPDVLSAFDWLRRSPAIALGSGPGVTVVERPTIVGHDVRLEERVATPDMPSGIRYLRDVDVKHLLDLSSESSQVPDLFEAYCRSTTPVILPDFLGALSVMLAKGILVDREAGGPTPR